MRAKRSGAHADTECFANLSRSPQHATLTFQIKSVARFDLDRGHPVREQCPRARQRLCQQLLIIKPTRRPHRRFDAAAGSSDLGIAGTGQTGFKFVGALPAVYQVGVAINEAGRQQSAVGIDDLDIGCTGTGYIRVSHLRVVISDWQRMEVCIRSDEVNKAVAPSDGRIINNLDARTDKRAYPGVANDTRCRSHQANPHYVGPESIGRGGDSPLLRLQARIVGMNEPTQTRCWTSAGWQAMPPGLPKNGDWRLPGVANTHSHAFQRAMSGLTERRGPGADSFWSWRERMYAMAARFDPDTLRDVAAQLYMEMLEVGYSSVCEFHYLHHAADGTAYADPAEMALALIDAAQEVGIALVLLPTLYQVGGFDMRPLAARQMRFFNTTEAYLTLLQRLDGLRRPGLEIGVAFHSLRAVPEPAMREVLVARSNRPQPIHLHIAEQVAEVDDCLAHRGARPVAWLLDHAPVDARWCLVHATHLDSTEVSALAAAGACVALCPTTEANLGDGLFPLGDYLAAGGHFGLGSDSHATVALSEELRWLEYGQRLLHQRRNIAALAANDSTGETLFSAALAGGQQACGDSTDQGWFTLRADAIELAERSANDIIDSWLFGSSRALVRAVWVNGVQQVVDGRHRLRDVIEPRYRKALGRLFSNI